ncbi:MAG: AgmX/PglI C-terminal domain-containing protein [Gammaproteobacteria bacterium]|nr:AgmX/PglI C-terminal domain-containing protein [Gammaproteobacteria bacterium]
MTVAIQNLYLQTDALLEQDKRFIRIVRNVLIAFLVLAIIVPFLPVFDLARDKKEEIPPRFAKVLMEKKQPPKPPKPITKPKAEPDLPKKEEIKPDKPKEVKKKKKPKVAKKQSVQEKVAKMGLLALRSELVSMQEDASVNRITQRSKNLLASAKTQAKPRSTPKLTHVNQGSGGIDTSKLSKRTTKTELSQRTLTQVQSAEVADSDMKRDGDERRNVRTIEELRLVIERHKGSFNTLFNRQLRKTPGLQGKVLFELVIAPSGDVTSVRILQSELHSPKLERKFLVKWKSINFGAKDVAETIISYPLDFFPS